PSTGHDHDQQCGRRGLALGDEFCAAVYPSTTAFVGHSTRAHQCASRAQQLSPLSGDCWRCCSGWSGPALARGHPTGLGRSDEYSHSVAHRRNHSPRFPGEQTQAGEQKGRALSVPLIVLTQCSQLTSGTESTTSCCSLAIVLLLSRDC